MKTINAIARELSEELEIPVSSRWLLNHLRWNFRQFGGYEAQCDPRNGRLTPHTVRVQPEVEEKLRAFAHAEFVKVMAKKLGVDDE